MKQFLVVFVLTFLAAAPAGAQTAGGMSAMSYYVGTWSCVGGPVGAPPANATVTAVMNGNILNSSVSVPVQPGMSEALNVTFAISYDGKGHYSQTTLDSSGAWGVSSAPTWTGNTEQWTDVATSDGKLAHGTVVRTDNDHYTYAGYGTPASTTPMFKTACVRQSS
jgi:hypothetical protein